MRQSSGKQKIVLQQDRCVGGELKTAQHPAKNAPAPATEGTLVASVHGGLGGSKAVFLNIIFFCNINYFKILLKIIIFMFRLVDRVLG